MGKQTRCADFRYRGVRTDRRVYSRCVAKETGESRSGACRTGFFLVSDRHNGCHGSPGRMQSAACSRPHAVGLARLIVQLAPQVGPPACPVAIGASSVTEAGCSTPYISSLDQTGPRDMTQQTSPTESPQRAAPPAHAAAVDLGAYFPERIALYFGAIFLVYGIHLTYFPVWLAWRGLTPEQIGIVTALPILLRVVLTPIIGVYADRTGRHRTIIIVLSVIASVMAVGAWLAPDTPWLVVTAVPFAVFMVSVLPLVDTVAVAGVRAAGHDYGRMRLWGSLTFLLATLIAGAMLDAFGAGSIIWGIVAATLATACVAFFLPQPTAALHGTVSSPLPIEPTGPPLAPPVGPLRENLGNATAVTDSGYVGRLLRLPIFLAFILAVGAVQGSHAALYAFGALHLQGQGVSGRAFGTLWVIAILAETALFAWSAPFVARFGAVRLLILGGVAAVFRWGVMSVDPSYAIVFALQALHALTFGATHLGAMHFIAKAVPGRGAGTAQALHAAIGNGLIMAAAIYATGYIYPRLGGSTYLVMGGLALAGTAAAVYVHKTWDGRAIL